MTKVEKINIGYVFTVLDDFGRLYHPVILENYFEGVNIQLPLSILNDVRDQFNLTTEGSLADFYNFVGFYL